MSTDGAPRPSQPAKLTFALVCLSTLGNFVAQGLLYPALPLYLTRELHTSKAVAGLVVSVLALTSIAIRPWAGSFIDRVGRRPLLIAGPALATLSAAGLLTMKFVLAVLLMRLVQGAGSAMTYSSAVAAVADVAPPERRAGYLALFSTFFYVGFALGPFIAELLIESSGFDAVWWTVGAFTAFGAVVALFVHETRPAGMAGAAPVPMLHRLFHPAARLPGMVFFCTGIGWTAIASFLSLYAREIGLSNSDVLFIALSISVLATRFLSGGLADRFGRLAVALPCLAVLWIPAWNLAYEETIPTVLERTAERLLAALEPIETRTVYLERQEEPLRLTRGGLRAAAFPLAKLSAASGQELDLADVELFPAASLAEPFYRERAAALPPAALERIEARPFWARGEAMAVLFHPWRLLGPGEELSLESGPRAGAFRLPAVPAADVASFALELPVVPRERLARVAGEPVRLWLVQDRGRKGLYQSARFRPRPGPLELEIEEPLPAAPPLLRWYRWQR